MSLGGFTLLELAASALATGSAVVGLYIATLAYRGLRRHENESMRFLAVGLILLTGVTYATAFVGTVLLHLRVLPLPAQDPFRLLVRLFQFVGLLFIAYSLYVRR